MRISFGLSAANNAELRAKPTRSAETSTIRRETNMNPSARVTVEPRGSGVAAASASDKDGVARLGCTARLSRFASIGLFYIGRNFAGQLGRIAVFCEA